MEEKALNVLNSSVYHIGIGEGIWWWGVEGGDIQNVVPRWIWAIRFLSSPKHSEETRNIPPSPHLLLHTPLQLPPAEPA